jgi:poly-gamma-glutamate synthesis protein (capsule biosynthesis protein)
VSVTRKFNFLFLSALACVALACQPGEPAPATFTLAFAGDVMLGRGVAQALAGNWETAFSQVRPWLAEADLAFANLESPLTTKPQIANGYDLRAAPQAITALHVAGFDIMSLANNHSLDAGEAGRAETRATLSAAGIVSVVERETGHLVSRQAPYPAIVYQLLAFDDSTVPLDLEAASRMVAEAKEKVDLTIVSVHWGGEYQVAPSPRQQSIALALAHAGADLIVGHGPHVLQPVERVGQTLVAYSLGNFIFDQPYPIDCRWGLVLRVTRLAVGKRMTVELLPTVVERGRVRLAGPLEAPAILGHLTRGRGTD